MVKSSFQIKRQKDLMRSSDFDSRNNMIDLIETKSNIKTAMDIPDIKNYSFGIEVPHQVLS